MHTGINLNSLKDKNKDSLKRLMEFINLRIVTINNNNLKSKRDKCRNYSVRR
jgi:hypothetical protein